MFKNFSPKNFFKRHGQVVVLYALIIPIFLTFAGVGLDLGWYYLNVSRLQNAADAAAVAGAGKFIEDTNEKGFASVGNYSFINNVVLDYSRKYAGLTSEEKDTIKAANEAAENYAVQNIGSKKNVDFGTTDNPDVRISIVDAWSKSKEDKDKKVDMTVSLYDYGTSFYYEVTLTEVIEHLFMPGWFDDMNAPVKAVVKLSQTPEMGPVINSNVIVGNWEVQNKYRQQSVEKKGGKNVYATDADGNYIYPKDADGNYIYTTDSSGNIKYHKDASGNILTDANGVQLPEPLFSYVYSNLQAYTERFQEDLYTGAWNHFQDFYHHYEAGNFYRTEVIDVFDDVDYSKSEPYGKYSSVAATAATINNNPSSPSYNPEQKDTRKTYKDGINDKSTVGLPYTADRLDSVNVDFRPEVGFSKTKKIKIEGVEVEVESASKRWLSEDWDLHLDNTDVAFNNKKWNRGGSNVITDEDVKRMRVHASINFGEPYTQRAASYRDKDEYGRLLPDILWGRIESEPMLASPDARNGYATKMSTITGLNSVRQLIINATKSNDGDNYRPVVIFYEGPESNDDIYPEYRARTDVLHRKSLPVILNLAKPFRGVLYAPNSPVVVVGSAKNQFKGFVVAKSYLRLKDDTDFILGGYRYFDNAQTKKNEYFKATDENGNVFFTNAKGEKQENKTEDNYQKFPYYYLKGDKSGTKYYKMTENPGTEYSIDMYIDENGNVQYAESNDLPSKVGKYDNFGRTEFTTHGYKVLKESASNLLLSGS